MSRLTYPRQLAAWCAGLARGQTADLAATVVSASADEVACYLQVGWGERRALLTQELALVGLAFDDFAELIDRFLCTVPKAAQAPHGADQQRFLRWLKQRRDFTPQQRAFVAYQRAEYACLRRARRRRAQHLAFQRLRGRGAAELSDGLSLWRVNPVRAWAKLAAADQAGDAVRESHVLFFAVGENIETLRVSLRERRWLCRLPATWAGTFQHWTAKTHCRQPRKLQQSLRAWLGAGLVAVENAKAM